MNFFLMSAIWLSSSFMDIKYFGWVHNRVIFFSFSYLSLSSFIDANDSHVMFVYPNDCIAFLVTYNLKVLGFFLHYTSFANSVIHKMVMRLNSGIRFAIFAKYISISVPLKQNQNFTKKQTSYHSQLSICRHLFTVLIRNFEFEIFYSSKYKRKKKEI